MCPETPAHGPSSFALLSPTSRTVPSRARKRFRSDRADLLAFLDDALIGHLGAVVGDHPVVLPMAFGVDLDGPDEGGTIYMHASVAAGWRQGVDGQDVCFTVTELDGLVAARSRKKHSMNYRCAVIIGQARLVDDPDERHAGLTAIVEHMIPGRSATLRADSRKELAAVTVVAVPLREASLKIRAEGANDEPEDETPGTWAGVIPLRRVASAPLGNADIQVDPPEDIARRAVSLGWTPGD